MFIGMFLEVIYIDDFCIVEKFSFLYIFSDGVYEIYLFDGEIWGIDNFINLILEYYRYGYCDINKILDYI